jgi:glycosyltransferase involved in cell wall biosynthesis
MFFARSLPVKVWFPTIQGGSGADIFTRRSAAALQRHGVAAEISWFHTYYQFAPFLLGGIAPPPGTNVIHAVSWSGFAFHRSRVPLIVTEQLDVLDRLHGPYRGFARALYHQTLIRSYTRASFRAASIVTAVSQSTAASLARILPAHSIRVIYNWVNTQTFQPRGARTAPGKRFRLLFVGNLTNRKGADLLVPIMKRLGERFELRFTSGLRDLRLPNIEANMRSIGRLTTDDELAAAYNDCDAFLFPSRLEGLPIAPLEAMACGKPVIASRASSLPEVVEDGVTGILCEPNDVGAFALACEKLSANRELTRAYGEAARERVQQLFSEEVVIPQYVALYEKMLDGSAR